MFLRTLFIINRFPVFPERTRITIQSVCSSTAHGVIVYSTSSTDIKPSPRYLGNPVPFLSTNTLCTTRP